MDTNYSYADTVADYLQSLPEQVYDAAMLMDMSRRARSLDVVKFVMKELTKYDSDVVQQALEVVQNCL